MKRKPEYLSPTLSTRAILSSFMLDILAERCSRRGDRPQAVREQRLALLRYGIISCFIAGSILWLLIGGGR
ncbi:hypothetical protein MRS76_24875 [Rhizobiaceae bacterium n13]|uniref:Uncharacterized protein n=1 Tax=Ferirhizobium litorale TaxID=2927786 RepID=A0AAE3QGE6_9HYPH|nr:hypothetical protein [Fererhizobium litorale]MDI7865147.1 hypothetical protein [Fererhizobium litorale]MDI7922881.1 hypothetical protein [Fererhizobium litorale]